MITFFLDIYDYVYNFVTGVEFSRVKLFLELLSWTVSIFLGVLTAILLKKSDAGWWLRERAYARKIAYGKPDQSWNNILKRLNLKDDANMKLAVIEADNLMDDLLKRMSLPGETMGERLQQFERHELASIDQVWEAHKLRNRIVHEPDLSVSYEEAEQAVKGFEAALKELEYF